HLSACAGCRQSVAQLQAEADAANLIEIVSPPEDFTVQVMRRVETAEARRPAYRVQRSLSLNRAGWTAAAFAALALALGYFVSLPPTGVREASVTEEVQVVEEKPETPASEMPVNGGQQEVAELPPAVTPKTTPPATAPSTVIAKAPEPAFPSSETLEPELTADEWLELAAYEEDEGSLEEALAAYEAAAEEPEAREVALLGVGRVYEKMGFMIAALEAYDEALAVSASDPLSNGRNEG
nr:hypothetical protein [Armatimonadota bacterium]NIO98180.1 hypothetical protein [Armatimonadota bacterium]NIT31905.1 hypothetical protein [Armatimonadota bacterium]